MLADPASPFIPRALARDPNSPAASALAAAGAQVVKADIDDAESVHAAFEGAHGAFCVTFYWNHFSVDKEQAQVRMFAAAARENRVQHVVWSTLEDTRQFVPLSDSRMPTLHGKYKVPHFDGKGEANRFFTDARVPTTFMNTSFYWDNFITFGMGPKKQPDGSYVLALPMGERPLPGIAAEDIGRCAYGIFKRPELIGSTVGIAGEHLTGSQMATSLSRALNIRCTYAAVPFDAYRALGFPGADDLGNMFQFKHDFNDIYLAHRPLAFSRTLNPQLQTLDMYLANHKAEIPL
jgi:uncharacterized protein YbjT (DUF2867 family)